MENIGTQSNSRSFTWKVHALVQLVKLQKKKYWTQYKDLS